MAEKESFSRSLTLKIIGGISVSVLSAILIAYFTGEEEKPPVEGHGVELYDHPSGVFSLTYPRFLKKISSHEEKPNGIYLGFGTLPPKSSSFTDVLKWRWDTGGKINFLLLSVIPIEPQAQAQQNHTAKSEELLDIPFPGMEVVSKKFGDPPKNSLYEEWRDSGISFSEEQYLIHYRETKEMYFIRAVMWVDAERREEFRKEIDDTFASITLNTEAARRVIPSKRELARRERAASVIMIEIQDKRFFRRTLGVGGFGGEEEVIGWREVYNPVGISKPTKNVKALLQFADLSGKVKINMPINLDRELQPGKKTRLPVSFTYDESNDRHRWMRSTPLEEMKIFFAVRSIVYADGTEEVLE